MRPGLGFMTYIEGLWANRIYEAGWTKNALSVLSDIVAWLSDLGMQV